MGLGPCGVVGQAALGTKGATTAAWTVGGGGVSGQGLSLGLGLGLGAWGPMLLGLGIVALGSYLYVNRTRMTVADDELAAVINGIDR